MYNQSFQGNSDEIIAYIKCLEIQKDVLCELSQEDNDNKIVVEDYFTKTAEYEKNLTKVVNSPVQYNAVIISLYGCFEAFIDKTFTRYIELLFRSADNYEMLPEKMKDKHLKRTGDFLLNSQRYLNYGMTSQEAVKNLFECMEDFKSAKLNLQLILSHGGNLRITQVVELMTDLGIVNALHKILNSNPYIQFYADKYGIDTDSAIVRINEKNKLEHSNLFEELDTLVEQRNNVAHGWVENRLTYNTIQSEIICFLNCLGNIIEQILIEEYYTFLYNNGKLIKFSAPKAVIDNHILCINNSQALLKTGNYIFAECNKKIYCLEILELKIGSKFFEEITDNDIDVGINVNGHIKKNWNYYYYI